MKKNYRWGILGAGKIADKFCTALSFVEGAEVYAVASRDIEKAKQYADKYNATVYYDNYEALRKDENIDIIYIAIPHALHFEQAMACIQQKKPVLCEKPMTLSFHQTKILIETAAENKVFLMEGMWTACMPFIKRIKEIIEQDIIGEINYLSADFGFKAPLDVESRLYNKALGGGSLMDVGIYPLSFATMFLGKPESIKVISKLSTTGVDEYCNILLKYGGGATAHLLSSITFNTAIEATIIGSKGSIKVDSPWFKATTLTVSLNDGEVQHYSMPHQSNGFEYEIMEVMNCLDNKLLESDKVPHHFSLTISRLMEDILAEVGVNYESQI
ncbi:MAG: Gfo/Idh/MocA family oxidoreductase [Ferruginibacter sp.]